jgi:hypothetical protein
MRMMAKGEKLTIVSCSISDASAYVDLHHRHHHAPVGAKFAVAVADEAGEVRGVALVGRSVSRMLQDGWTLEVVRVATDGARNACSALYAAAWRVTRALGYRRLVTYVLGTESGTSVKAAGWRCLGEAGGGSWSRTERPRVDRHPTQVKIRWEKTGGTKRCTAEGMRRARS